MPNRALFLPSRRVDRSTITVSSELALLTGANLKDQQPETVWRANGCAHEWMAFDMGGDFIVDFGALIGGNLSDDGLVQLRLAADIDDLLSDPDVDTGQISAWPATGRPTDEDWSIFSNLIPVENENAYRFGRIDIYDPTNADGYVEIARPFWGKAVRPSFDVDVNPAVGLISADARRRTPFNKMFTDPRGRQARRWVLPISAVREDDLWESLFDMQRLLGTSGDFFFSLDPTATTHFHRKSMQASFPEGPQFDAQPAWDGDQQVFRTTMTIEEFT